MSESAETEYGLLACLEITHSVYMGLCPHFCHQMVPFPIANMVWLNEDECLNHGVNTMLVVNIVSMKISVIVLIVSGITMVIIL
ncbi:Uncharacterised protein [Yersinia similis]|uniref:Uncharacterized protein n=1 Tax=Yersinia similis TaxID=367190 RepID=A0A0T9P2L0_9GAMM|nr:Uncharacterised protein [Yersinia similis]CNB91048.1 Uncharacterised protein [Yersinia similis]CNE14759.1 Uncharacterised protein [Yersinia similis]CNF26711.1 Uncharacterised protein [Yersinia similis]CNH41631.1 Uncharacterised protein [Yersinia similis]